MKKILFDELDEKYDGYSSEDLEILFDNSYDNHLYVLSGKLGLWDGQREGYYPHVASSIKEAIDFATDGWGICYITIYEENYGRLFVRVSHHDGTNYLEIRELTSLGENLLLTHDIKTILERKGATKNVKYSKTVAGNI